MGNTALKKDLRERLHISNSQIRSYLMCSQRYYFQYYAGLPAERQSINLTFGSALHVVLERYFKTLKNTGERESFDSLREVLTDYLAISIADAKTPLGFNSTLPDLEKAQDLGAKMLAVTLENAKSIKPEHVVDVEMPLSMPLHDEDGNSLEIDLIGFLDLLLRDGQGNLIVVDHKTAKVKLSQSLANQDLQMSAYGILLEANGLIKATEDLNCRFDLMRKLKTPVFEQVETIRTPHDRKRFLWLTRKVLSGIASQVFIPNRSWLCNDCAWAGACSKI